MLFVVSKIIKIKLLREKYFIKNKKTYNNKPLKINFNVTWIDTLKKHSSKDLDCNSWKKKNKHFSVFV